jgi:hypothetical protein
MTDHIKKIREACVAANPSILDLKFGCEVSLDEPENEKEMAHPDRIERVLVMRTTENNVYLTVEPYSEDVFEIWNDEMEFARVNLKILGRPIRLADVMATIFTSWNTDENIKKRPLDDDSYTEFFKDEREVVIKVVKRWNMLDDNLEHQSPETLEFIANLLS